MSILVLARHNQKEAIIMKLYICLAELPRWPSLYLPRPLKRSVYTGKDKYGTAAAQFDGRSAMQIKRTADYFISVFDQASPDKLLLCKLPCGCQHASSHVWFCLSVVSVWPAFSTQATCIHTQMLHTVNGWIYTSDSLKAL